MLIWIEWIQDGRFAMQPSYTVAAEIMLVGKFVELILVYPAIEPVRNH